MTFGIIFDMDGVLFDSGPLHFESWKLLAREENLPGIDEEWFKDSFGRTAEEILSRLFKGDLSPEELRRLDRRKEFLYRKAARGRIVAMPGVRRLIDDLSARGWRIGIGSSGPRENVDLVAEELELEGRLSASVSAQDVKRGKPDPEVFLNAARSMGVPPERCVVVEDSPVGLEAARAAGMKVIAVTSTHPREALRPADRVVDSLEELTDDDVERLVDHPPSEGGKEAGS